MDTVQRIAKNTGVLFAAQVAGYAMGFFYIMYTARYLGASGFGVLSFALAFTAIFGILTDLGLQPLTVREVARKRELAPVFLSNLSAMKLLLSIVTLALIAITVNLMGYSGETATVVYIVALSVVVNSFTTMLYSIFQAYESMEYQSAGHLLNSVLMLGGAAVAIKAGTGVRGFALLYLAAAAACLVYGIVILYAKFPEVFSGLRGRKAMVELSFWKETLKESLPFGLGVFFMVIFYWVDSVMLSVMKGDSAVGWYNAAYRIVMVLLFIPHAFIAAIYPVMSVFYKTSEESLRSAHERSFKYLTIIGIPIAVATTILARRMILMIFGVEYTSSVLPLQILAWSVVFIFMSITFGNLFNCLDRQAVVTKITGVCVVANVVLNILLIPRYSLVGASIATVLTEAVSLILCFVWGYRIGYSIPGRRLSGILARVLISSVLMGLYIALFHNMNLIALVPSAAIIYFLILYISNGIDKEDISLLQSAVLRNSNVRR